MLKSRCTVISYPWIFCGIPDYNEPVTNQLPFKGKGMFSKVACQSWRKRDWRLWLPEEFFQDSELNRQSPCSSSRFWKESQWFFFSRRNPQLWKAFIYESIMKAFCAKYGIMFFRSCKEQEFCPTFGYIYVALELNEKYDIHIIDLRKSQPRASICWEFEFTHFVITENASCNKPSLSSHIKEFKKSKRHYLWAVFVKVWYSYCWWWAK